MIDILNFFTAEILLEAFMAILNCLVFFICNFT